MTVFQKVFLFLNKHCVSKNPLLLALSGGPDSLCLFYALLNYREITGQPFHVAHVDHGWRENSSKEATELHLLMKNHEVPFHLKVLNPNGMKGNLEAECRRERYQFFEVLNQQFKFEGILTGHHQDDQVETVFKRILEGAHWSRWDSLKATSLMNGMRLLRPLLSFTKKEIQDTVNEHSFTGFQDPTNLDSRYLRARLRQEIFPWLNQQFGKHVQPSILAIKNDIDELNDYFEEKINDCLKQQIFGPFGVCLDLQTNRPIRLLEIKYLLRSFCKMHQVFLSRTILEQVAEALLKGKADCIFSVDKKDFYVDRYCFFLIKQKALLNHSQVIAVQEGEFALGDWYVSIVQSKGQPKNKKSLYQTQWKNAWGGELKVYLPFEKFTIEMIEKNDGKKGNYNKIKKRWSQNKIPAFLYNYFPLICKNGWIHHEFLTSKNFSSIEEGEHCWEVNLQYKKLEL